MALANEQQEDVPFAATFERKYYHKGNCFKKQSLRPDEWKYSPYQACIHVPRLGNERLLNEAATLQYIRDNTDIPVPQIYRSKEEAGVVTIEMEYVDGVGMDSLTEVQRTTVAKELELHLKTLGDLRSRKLGGPSGIVVPPYRAMLQSTRKKWKVRAQEVHGLVFCHNDLSMQNIIVDSDTLRIKAIIDWEYAGFYPPFFERRFFERDGPSVALHGEIDDSMKLVNYLETHVEVDYLTT